MSIINNNYILINIVGKIFTPKAFNIKCNISIKKVKELILARLKINGYSITPSLDYCYLLVENDIILDDNKSVEELCNEKLLYNNCNVSIDIQVKTKDDRLLSYNSLLDNKLEFGKTNIEDSNVVTAGIYNEKMNGLIYVTRLIRNQISKISEESIISSHHELAWDNRPIDDSEWCNT